MKGITKYLIAGAIAIVFAVVFYFNTLTLSPAGYYLPRILIAVIILLAIAMMIEAYVQSRKKDKVEAKSENNGQDEEDTQPINYKRAFIFGLMIAIYVFTIKPLGYFIVTPVYVIVAYLYLKSTKLINIILIALGFTGFVYVLFVMFLKLPIPLGPM